MDEGKQTLQEIIIGIVLFAVLFVCLGLFWEGRRFLFILGVMLGACTALAGIFHIHHSICHAIELDEESAAKFTKIKSIFRLTISIILLAVSVYFGGSYLGLGLLMGLLCLKFSAYIQPLTHRFIVKKFHKKGR